MVDNSKIKITRCGWLFIALCTIAGVVGTVVAIKKYPPGSAGPQVISAGVGIPFAVSLLLAALYCNSRRNTIAISSNTHGISYDAVGERTQIAAGGDTQQDGDTRVVVMPAGSPYGSNSSDS